jgi:hypothetical protein
MMRLITLSLLVHRHHFIRTNLLLGVRVDDGERVAGAANA